MLAIAKACSRGELAAEVALVMSNNPRAAALSAARELGIRTVVVDHTRYTDRDHFDAALTENLEFAKPDWIALAGFMRILGRPFVERWQGKLVNIHPSLLPLYPGLDTHRRAITAGDSEAGATVHIVTAELDQGPIIAQTRVPILRGDTPETLASRVITEEHALYVRALKQCITNANR